MRTALDQATALARGGIPAVIRPAPDMSLQEAKWLLPIECEAMVLTLQAPLALRTIDNVRRLVVDGARMGTYPPVVIVTHADTGLLDVVLGTPCAVIELPHGLSPGRLVEGDGVE
jgi:hypothetical protein